MQRISREASRVSNAFCLFESPILLRSKRSGIRGRHSDGAHVRCDGGKSVFHDSSKAANISDRMRHFVGGQQKLMPELLAMIAPTMT